MRLAIALRAAAIPFTLAWSAALAQQAATPSANDAAQTRGQLLYDTHCIKCHTSQIHWRAANAARDWTMLRAQVQRWQAQAGQSWSDDDVDEVVRYLNDTIYHFPAPRGRG